MRRRVSQHGRTVVGWVAMLAIVMAGAPGMAAEADEKEEEEVNVVEAKNQKERPSLKDDGDGPQFEAEEFIAEKNFATVKKQDEAIYRLKDLLESTPKEDPERAEIQFNLAEMYWDKSKYYEQEAFRKQDECYALEEAGKKKRAKSCKRQKEDMLSESDRLRGEAVSLYEKIVLNHSGYEELDKVLFYLATNLDQVGRADEAMKVYRKLLSKFPNTEHKPNILLALGEHYFDKKEDPKRALQFYQKVTEFEGSSVYSYAKYKAAWCYYNMDQKDQALQVFIDVIEYAKSHPNQPNAEALVNQARNDIVMTYSEIGSPEKAIPFFEDLTDDREEVLKMAERLAIQYSDKSKYEYSTKMYRKLIKIRRESVKTVDYQYEIVRNHTTQDPYNKATIEELVKLMKLIQLVDQGKFNDSEEVDLPKTKDRVQQLVRQWSTRFHREAQVTKSNSLYKMAYFLYDNFVDTFPDSEHIYEMTFYDAEILYRLERWKKAAKMYDKVIEINPEGEYTEKAAHGMVLAYFEVVNTSEERADLENPIQYQQNDDRAEDVENEDGEENDKAPEQEEISDIKKELVEACKTYQKHVPEGDKIVDVKYTMARVYYEHNHLKRAIEVFKDIAFNHPEHDLAVVSANLHLDAINLLDDFGMLHEAVSKYSEERPFEDQEFYASVDKLKRAIRFKLCREKENAEKWRPAANCYVNFYKDFPDSNHVDKALYNAALAFERVKELGKAIQVRVFLLKATPNSDLAPETLFNIGGNYHALAVYSRAAKFYEKFVDSFPDKENMAEEALANASTFRQGLGHYEKAIEDYNKYLELFGDNPDRAQKVADVAFQTAKIYKRQDRPKQALEQYREYIDEYADKGTQDRLLQAHVKIGLYYWEHGDKDRALDEFERTLEVYKSIPDKEKEKLTKGRDAAAQAKFMTAEDIHQEMREIGVESSNEKELQEKFKEKLEVAQEAQKIYEEVIKFRRPDWAIAALYKIGAQYQDFANTIRDSPVPDRLSYNQKEIYRGLLEDKAMVVEKKAADAYKRALNVATEESWFNEYSKKAEVRLADLRPKQYRKPSEIRATPDNVQDGYTRAGFIHELEEEREQLDDKLGDEAEENAPVERKGPAAEAEQSSEKPSS